MAGTTSAPSRTAQTTLTRMIRVMFPHERFPDGPYERTVAALLAAADEDLRLRGQLEQGVRDLQAAGFEDLDDAAALEHLRSVASGPFFEAVRAKVILTLYDDREVWSLLGYEGPSYDQGGYLERGFDDLDWLPTPRIELGPEAC